LICFTWLALLAWLALFAWLAWAKALPQRAIAGMLHQSYVAKFHKLASSSAIHHAHTLKPIQLYLQVTLQVTLIYFPMGLYRRIEETIAITSFTLIGP